MNRLIITIIASYQKTLSPDHGVFKARYPYGYCRHYPSCSEYSRLAFTHQGFFKASFLSAKRVAKCNPFVSPSVDTSYTTEVIK